MSLLLEPPSLETNIGGFDFEFAEEGDGFVEVYHASRWMGRIRAFEVFVDDALVGLVDRKNPGRFRVPVGRHFLTAKMDWLRTQSVAVMVEKNDVIRFDCGLEPDFFRCWMRTLIIFPVMLGFCALAAGLANVFPQHKEIVTWIFLFGGILPCAAAIGASELIVVGKMLPWTCHGKVIRLFRHRDSDQEC